MTNKATLETRSAVAGCVIGKAAAPSHELDSYHSSVDEFHVGEALDTETFANSVPICEPFSFYRTHQDAQRMIQLESCFQNVFCN